MELARVIKKPVITEKSTALLERGWYTFQVARLATKKEIARAIERYFDKVKVKSVKTAIIKGKVKQNRRSRKLGKKRNWKKAFFQLAEGDKIDILPAAPAKGGKKK